MEAISVGSSAAFKPVAPEVNQYEPVTPIPESETYSYPRVSRSERHLQTQSQVLDIKSLYDDPDASFTIQAQLPSQNQTKDKSPTHSAHPSRAKARRTRSKSPSKPPTERVVPVNQTTVPPASPFQRVHLTVSDDKEPYDVVDATASTDSEPIEEYVDMDEENPPQQAKSPRRSVTVPKELSALAETSIEDLPNMNPSEAQLWMLNQMQKLVEKFAGIYETTAVGPLPKSMRGKVLPAQLQDIKEIYDNVQTEPPTTQHMQNEGSASGRKISRQPKTVYGAPPFSTNTKLLAAERSPRHQSAAAYIHRPPTKPKSDSPGKLSVCKLVQLYLNAISIAEIGKRSPKTIQQKRAATHAEMISKHNYIAILK